MKSRCLLKIRAENCFSSISVAFMVVLGMAIHQKTLGLTIVPAIDSSVTSDRRGSAILQTIKSTLAYYDWSFSDKVDVNIAFFIQTDNLGTSKGVWATSIAYSDYINALALRQTSLDDALTLAHLAAGVDNPFTRDANMWVNFANARALGFIADTPVGGPGIIRINESSVFRNDHHL